MPRARVAERDRANTAPPTTADADRDEAYERFDASALQLLEEVVDARGFDPYGHGTLRSRTKTGSARTDLRALSAQILAERAARAKSGDR